MNTDLFNFTEDLFFFLGLRSSFLNGNKEFTLIASSQERPIFGYIAGF